MIPPKCQAMVLCEEVVRDGKDSLLRLFNAVWCGHFPMRQPLICVFAELSNGRGRVKVKVELVDDEDDLIEECEEAFDFQDPLDTLAVCLRFVDIEFERRGEYRFKLTVSGHPVAERVLHVLPLEEKRNPR